MRMYTCVCESMCIPMDYYENNVTGTLNLVKAMTIAKVKRLVYIEIHDEDRFEYDEHK